MPFKSFDTATMEVDGNASSLIILHSAPLMCLGMKNALNMYANLSGRTIHHGACVADMIDTVRAARRGSVIVCDVTCWTALERDAGGLRDHIRAEGVAICLVACTDESAYRLLQLRGVSGVVTPDCDGRELETAVSEIIAGRTYFKTEDRLAPVTGMAKLSSRQGRDSRTDDARPPQQADRLGARRHRRHGEKPRFGDPRQAWLRPSNAGHHGLPAEPRRRVATLAALVPRLSRSRP